MRGLPAIGLLLAGLIGIGVWASKDGPLLPGDDRETNMIEIGNTDWARAFTVFPDDIEEIERIWGEPLPDHLMFIGGLDWPAWGYVYRDPSDPAGRFRGESRDRMHLYKGSYRYDHPSGRPFDEIDPTEFEVTGLDGATLILHRRDQAPPVEYFHLVPEAPEDVLQPPGQE